eukprot:TRINITY_DN103518_c0_g1_i1.p1 TRINITY_DN103518_c0_g1~~TRINITY_DN103518_c0_g1_i1.p1  ORF type:complete len:639 (+),score=65.65 TRINITY_DN103518_c0_g1_i1:82-1998(+)
MEEEHKLQQAARPGELHGALSMTEVRDLANSTRTVLLANARIESRLRRSLRCQCSALVCLILLALCAGIRISLILIRFRNNRDGHLLPCPNDRLKLLVAETLCRQDEMSLAHTNLRHLSPSSGFWDYRGFLMRVACSWRMVKRAPNIVELRGQMLEVARLSAALDTAGEIIALQKLGESLTSLFLDLRGVWPKVAQIIAMRPDVIRWEPVRLALARSHDDCAPKPTEKVRAILAVEAPQWESHTILGKRLGTGSIGQIHALLPRRGFKIRLPDGTNVGEAVVKIAFHSEHWKMKQDFQVMEALGKNTGRDEVSALFRSIWLFISDSMKQIENEFNMSRETNLTKVGRQLVESANAEVQTCIASAFGLKSSDIPSLAVPRVIANPSTAVLILEKVSGVPLLAYLESLPEGDVREAAQVATFGSIFMWVGWMIFSAGFTHGDPHPGQFLFDTDKQRLWLLDWGLCQELSAEQSRDLHELFYLLHFQYDATALNPRLLQVGPAILEFVAGRLAMERVIRWAVSDMDAHHRHRIANVMRRMGFVSKLDSDLTLTVAAYGLFDTNVAYNDVELLNKWLAYDPVVAIPGQYLVLTRMISTIAGFARKLQGSDQVIRGSHGERWRFAELSNVRLWRRFVRAPAWL